MGFEWWRTRRPDAVAETLVRRLHAGLSDGQRAAICFDWDHEDGRFGHLRRFVANHWQVTPPCVRGEVFDAGQQALIRDIFLSLLDPGWHARILRQLSDDTKGHPWGQDQSIAILGDPVRGPFQFLFTGRHVTLRADGGSAPDVAFGGPVVYGHDASGRYREQPGHPGNVFWPQAIEASALLDRLDARQRALAVVEALPEEGAIAFGMAPQGLPAADMTRGQFAAFTALLASLAAPFRAEDRTRLARCLARQGGARRLHLAFSATDRMSQPHYDTWRIEGPAFVWHFQGRPHVHCWVHVAAHPDVPCNAHGGVFLHPGQDPLT